MLNAVLTLAGVAVCLFGVGILSLAFKRGYNVSAQPFHLPAEN